jgi:hypothetical protein
MQRKLVENSHRDHDPRYWLLYQAPDIFPRRQSAKNLITIAALIPKAPVRCENPTLHSFKASRRQLTAA